MSVSVRVAGDDDEHNLSPLMFGILSFSNPSEMVNYQETFGVVNARLYTGKEAYFYVGLADYFLSKNFYGADEEAVRAVTILVEDALKHGGLTAKGSETRIKRSRSYERNIYKRIMDKYKISYSDIRSIQENVNQTAKNMEESGLILDPFFEPFYGMLLMCLGLVPFSFTKRTKKGEVIYRKCQSLLWEYEFSKEKDVESIHIIFRMQKIIDSIKAEVINMSSRTALTGERSETNSDGE